MKDLDQMLSTFKHLKKVLRDDLLAKQRGIEFTHPSIQEWETLTRPIEKAAEALACSVPDLSPTDVQVLSTPLTPDQKKQIDFALLPRYAEALIKDEAPRDKLEFIECAEPMVDLRRVLDSNSRKVMWSTVPYNAACGEFGGKPRIFWLRESVAQLFAKAVSAFNAAGFIVQVEDCFRPPAVQEGLFRRRFKMIQAETPGLSREEILLEAQAKTASAPYRAAHMGGAAIDFTLRDNEGRPLDLGNPYPTGGAATILELPFVTWEQFRTRTLFATISAMTGLCPYPGEDWHVSVGDGLAALMLGETSVRYCAMRDFNRQSGEILPYDRENLFKHFSSEGLL